jgi:hypothetical protein
VNSTASTSEPLLTVGHWRATYLVRDGHPAPHDLQRRLDEAVAGQLAENCGRWLQQVLDPSDPSVWRIRELAMNFSADSNLASSDAAAQIWGRQFAARIQDILSHEDDSESVLRFPNQAAYVAQFVSDLVAAGAWGKWYYEEFEDLRVLSDSQAIRTVILRYSGRAAEIILQLASTRRLEPVLCSLTESAAREIFAACFERAAGGLSGVGLDKWTGIILELWNEAPLRSSTREENHFRDAVRLFARVASRFPGAESNIHVRTALESLLELRAVLSAIQSPSVLDAVLKTLAGGDLASAIGLARNAGVADPAAPLGFFAERLGGDAHWAAQAAAVILSGSFQERFLTAAKVAPGESVLSSFGSIFLLAPSLQELNLAEMAQAVAHHCEAPEMVSAMFRHLVAVKCFGQARASESADDPALRLFSGFEGRSFREALANLGTSTLSLEAGREIMLRSLADRGRIDDRCFFAEIVALPDGTVLLLRDLLHNEWLGACTVPTDRPDLGAFFRENLNKLARVLGAEPKILLLNSALAESAGDWYLRDAACRVAILRPNDDQLAGEIAAELGVTRERLVSTLATSEQELSYFSFSELWQDGNPDRDLDCASSLVAHAALKHFARRLMGFGASSPEYLYQNFLSGLTTIRSTDDRLEVRLAASPLSLVLRISGIQDQRYTLPWLEGREICLLPPQE